MRPKLSARFGNQGDFNTRSVYELKLDRYNQDVGASSAMVCCYILLTSSGCLERKREASWAAGGDGGTGQFHVLGSGLGGRLQQRCLGHQGRPIPGGRPTTVYDVTVASVSSSTSSVSRGEVVSVNVTTQNLGSTTETFNVNLRDDTDDRDITGLSVTLEPVRSSTLGLHWNTAGASGDAHWLTARADCPMTRIPATTQWL